MKHQHVRLPAPYLCNTSGGWTASHCCGVHTTVLQQASSVTCLARRSCKVPVYCTQYWDSQSQRQVASTEYFARTIQADTRLTKAFGIVGHVHTACRQAWRQAAIQLVQTSWIDKQTAQPITNTALLRACYMVTRGMPCRRPAAATAATAADMGSMSALCAAWASSVLWLYTSRLVRAVCSRSSSASGSCLHSGACTARMSMPSASTACGMGQHRAAHVPAHVIL